MCEASDEISSHLFIGKYQENIPLLIDCVPELSLYKPSMKELSQILHKNPAWTTAHLIAHLGFTECFSNNIVQKLVNAPCGESFMTPLHVALEAQQLGSVLELMDLDASLDMVDSQGYNAFHFAADTSREIIQALTVKTFNAAINMRDHRGCTPFHLACMAGNISCILEFLETGVDVNLEYVYDEPLSNLTSPTHSPSKSMKAVVETYANRLSHSDMKCGGTPLHWSKAPELTEMLIDHGCNVNARNFNGDTALHVLVRHNRLSCAVMILSHDADVDIQGSDGDTPLHLAVKNGDLSLVQTIIAFGADVNILNNHGETVRHLATAGKNVAWGKILYALHIVGARRCVDPMILCNEGCSSDGQFDGIPPENCAFTKMAETLFEEVLWSTGVHSSIQQEPCECQQSTPRQGCRVLCLDGGGIRGLVLIQILDELQRVLGKPLAQCFDMISGTSTGGILALALASGKTVRECRCLYFRLKDKVFVGIRPYNTDVFERFLQKELGDSTTMADIEKPKIMITATRRDRQPADLHIFRNYKSPLELLNHVEVDVVSDMPVPYPSEIFLWEVARATSSAPTYFRSFGPYIDGGLISNNPTLDTLTEIHQCNQALRATGQSSKMSSISVVVSLGTGRIPVVPVKSTESSRKAAESTSFFSTVCRLAKEATNMGELVIDQVTQPDGRVTARALALCDMLRIPYLRLNPQLTENVALDEVNTKTLVKMLWETTAYMRAMRHELERLKPLLT